MQLFDLFESVSVSADADTIRWKPSRSSSDYETVWVDIRKIDASWRKDADMYVGPGGEGGIGRRYKAFGEWLASTDEPVITPDIGWNPHYNRVQFGNGRHRFSWMRDHGVSALPVTVSDEDADTVRKLFGTSERVSRLP